MAPPCKATARNTPLNRIAESLPAGDASARNDERNLPQRSTGPRSVHGGANGTAWGLPFGPPQRPPPLCARDESSDSDSPEAEPSLLTRRTLLTFAGAARRDVTSSDDAMAPMDLTIIGDISDDDDFVSTAQVAQYCERCDKIVVPEHHRACTANKSHASLSKAPLLLPAPSPSTPPVHTNSKNNPVVIDDLPVSVTLPRPGNTLDESPVSSLPSRVADVTQGSARHPCHRCSETFATKGQLLRHNRLNRLTCGLGKSQTSAREHASPSERHNYLPAPAASRGSHTVAIGTTPRSAVPTSLRIEASLLRRIPSFPAPETGVDDAPSTDFGEGIKGLNDHVCNLQALGGLNTVTLARNTLQGFYDLTLRVGRYNGKAPRKEGNVVWARLQDMETTVKAPTLWLHEVYQRRFQDWCRAISWEDIRNGLIDFEPCLSGATYAEELKAIVKYYFILASDQKLHGFKCPVIPNNKTFVNHLTHVCTRNTNIPRSVIIASLVPRNPNNTNGHAANSMVPQERDDEVERADEPDLVNLLKKANIPLDAEGKGYLEFTELDRASAQCLAAYRPRVTPAPRKRTLSPCGSDAHPTAKRQAPQLVGRTVEEVHTAEEQSMALDEQRSRGQGEPGSIALAEQQSIAVDEQDFIDYDDQVDEQQSIRHGHRESIEFDIQGQRTIGQDAPRGDQGANQDESHLVILEREFPIFNPSTWEPIGNIAVLAHHPEWIDQHTRAIAFINGTRDPAGRTAQDDQYLYHMQIHALISAERALACARRVLSVRGEA